MSGRRSTILEWQYHTKVVTNLTQIRVPELAKVIKKHAKAANRLRMRMVSKGW